MKLINQYYFVNSVGFQLLHAGGSSIKTKYVHFHDPFTLKCPDSLNIQCFTLEVVLSKTNLSKKYPIYPFTKFPSYLSVEQNGTDVTLSFTNLSDIISSVGDVDWVIVQLMSISHYPCGIKDNYAVRFSDKILLLLNKSTGS